VISSAVISRVTPLMLILGIVVTPSYARTP
jgi:hypothetical protein